MEISRRSLLKIGGVCALGLGTLPVVDALATAEKVVLPEGGTKKLAMVVDMKKCWEKGKQGCTDCITACHQFHNVPTIPNHEEEIKWIWTEPYEATFTASEENEFNAERFHGKPFILMCNHCTNPACVRVCPTQATWKRKEDGIVMMDFHRCIGCRFCMAACPYGSRSFNFSDPRPYIEKENTTFPTRERGVVEKCNFCNERLAEGLQPSCVEACKVGALIFGDLNDPKSDVRKLLTARFSIRRKPELGTEPNVYYLI